MRFAEAVGWERFCAVGHGEFQTRSALRRAADITKDQRSCFLPSSSIFPCYCPHPARTPHPSLPSPAPRSLSPRLAFFISLPTADRTSSHQHLSHTPSCAPANRPQSLPRNDNCRLNFLIITYNARLPSARGLRFRPCSSWRPSTRPRTTKPRRTTRRCSPPRSRTPRRRPRPPPRRPRTRPRPRASAPPRRPLTPPRTRTRPSSPAPTPRSRAHSSSPRPRLCRSSATTRSTTLMVVHTRILTHTHTHIRIIGPQAVPRARAQRRRARCSGRLTPTPRRTAGGANSKTQMRMHMH
ncbi:hypothetical protein DENSPDRAFT_268063 [Dentipellis sp. KUC8613]|nr:hypothetical protein DENSPDRAFT_268063 [Dentipellis sp. KUC8613]